MADEEKNEAAKVCPGSSCVVRIVRRVTAEDFDCIAWSDPACKSVRDRATTATDSGMS